MSSVVPPNPGPGLKALEACLQGRLRGRTDCAELARCYADAVQQHAIELTIGPGPAPTTLSGQRADLLRHVSRQLKRLVTEREIQALLRVTPAAALSLYRQLRAVYEDEVSEYVLGWALREARTDGRGDYGPIVTGRRILLRSEEARKTLIDELDRLGVPVRAKDDDDAYPYLVVVDRGFDLTPYGLKPWSGKNA